MEVQTREHAQPGHSVHCAEPFNTGVALSALSVAACALVSERIELFRKRYPVGRLTTSLVRHPDGWVVFRAALYRNECDARPVATGWAARLPGQTRIGDRNAFEEAETAAIDRALSHMGFVGETPAQAAVVPTTAPAVLRSPTPVATDPLASDLGELLIAAAAVGGAPLRVARVSRAISESRVDAARATRLISHFQRWLIRRAVQAPL